MQISNTLRVDEGNMLFHSVVYPKNEIWIKIAGFKEAYAFTTFVAKQVDILTFQRILFMLIVVFTHMLYKCVFSNIECHG